MHLTCSKCQIRRTPWCKCHSWLPQQGNDSDLMDDIWSQESVRDVCCILLNVRPSGIRAGAEKHEFEAPRHGRVCHNVDLHLIICSQRVPVYRASLLRQTWTTTLPPTLSAYFNRRTFGTTSWRRLRAAAFKICRRKPWNIWSICSCDNVTWSTRDRATADCSLLTMYVIVIVTGI